MRTGNEAGFSPLEALEPRRLLSAELLGSGTLELRGTGGDDIIIVQEGESAGSLVVFGVDGVDDGEIFEGVSKLRVKLGRGNDQARIDGNPLTPEGDEMTLVVLGAAGADAIESVTAPAKLVGGRGPDTIFGSTGDDKLVGLKGNDILAGGAGDDRLIGNWGNDQLFGEDGDDVLRGGRDRDILRGGRGRDELLGGRHGDDLFGGFGRDFLHGEGGRDKFRGDFDEWMDFRDRDAFWSDRMDNNPEAVTLPQEFWLVLNDLDTQFLDDFPDEVWAAVDSAQQFMASCGRAIQLFGQELDNLSDQQLEEVALDLLGVLGDFNAAFGDDPGSIEAGDVEDLINDIRDVMPGAVGDAFQGVIDCIDDEAGALNRLTRAVRASADPDLPEEFTSILGAVLIGF